MTDKINDASKPVDQKDLASWCLKNEFGFDDETASKFADWHLLHLNHVLDAKFGDSFQTDVLKEMEGLKEENKKLTQQLEDMKKSLQLIIG